MRSREGSKSKVLGKRAPCSNLITGTTEGLFIAPLSKDMAVILREENLGTLFNQPIESGFPQVIILCLKA